MVDQSRGLTSWADVHDHVRASYRDPHIEAIRCAFVLAIPPTPTAPGATVAVEARVIDAEHHWIAITSVIGSLKLLSPKEMLANNVRATIGTLCTREGVLAIRQTLPLGQLRSDDFDETVRALAQATLFVRARIGELEGR
jgi:hypothetical protein